MLVAYAGKDSLQIFKISKEVIQKIGSGSVDKVKPIRSLGKKVLIVGRDVYLHLRKRYPPVAAGDLKKIIALEIGDLFPLKNPAHSFRVFEGTTSHTLVDIWAWESAFTERIAASVFPFTHIIPEDAAKPEHVEIFLKGLGRYGETFKTLIFSGVTDAKAVAALKTLPLEVIAKQREYPACIDSVTSAKLADFALGGSNLADIIPVAMRGIIYLLIGIAVSFVVTGWNYNASVVEINKKINKLSGDMAALASGPKKEDRQDIVEELKKKLAEGASPLTVLDMIAGILPERSNVIRIVLGDKNLEITMQAEDPLSLIKEMGKSDMVKSLKLRGSPTKEPTSNRAPQDQSKGRYTFTVMVELK